jgi:prepilin peptidase CpaA
MIILSHVCLALAAVALLVSALHDLAVRTVPNSVVAVVALSGFGVALAEHRLAGSLVLALLLLVTTGFLWVRGLLGGADAKLLSACCLLVPPQAVGALLLSVALAGGVLCLPYLPGRHLFRAPRRGRPRNLMRRFLRCERHRLRRRGPLPYAVAISAGTLFMMLQGV